MTLNLQGLVCPESKQPLVANPDGTVSSADGAYTYQVDNGILKLMPVEQLNYTIVIPSRLQSTRLPQKPLAAIDEQLNLIQTVAYTASLTGMPVVVATDDALIADSVTAKMAALNLADQVQVCLTSTEHENGTERIAEVVSKLGIPDTQVIVNVQGDEPFFNPTILNELVSNFIQANATNPQVVMGTICQTAQEHEVQDPNAVKVVVDKDFNAIYFSRSPIPYPRNPEDFTVGYRKHAGVYCYYANFITAYKRMPMTPLARMESLEQLKVLENGLKIHLMPITGRGFVGVDTPADLSNAQQLKAQFWTEHQEAVQSLASQLNLEVASDAFLATPEFRQLYQSYLAEFAQVAK